MIENDGEMRGGKLVRDRIPEIIRADGAEPITRTASNAEYLPLLHSKLHEELGELLVAPPSCVAGEAADVLEALEAFCAVHGLTMAEVYAERERKHAERGGFDRRIVWLGNR
jgi:predicted house-cleaning noncanonical NTP pyrophosphatase (MazG superfamily)